MFQAGALPVRVGRRWFCFTPLRVQLPRRQVTEAKDSINPPSDSVTQRGCRGQTGKSRRGEVGMGTLNHPVSGTVDLAGLVAALAPVRRRGLRVTDRNFGPVLPNLCSHGTRPSTPTTRSAMSIRSTNCRLGCRLDARRRTHLDHPEKGLCCTGRTHRRPTRRQPVWLREPHRSGSRREECHPVTPSGR